MREERGECKRCDRLPVENQEPTDEALLGKIENILPMIRTRNKQIDYKYIYIYIYCYAIYIYTH